MRGESSALGIFLLWLHNSLVSDSTPATALDDDDDVEEEDDDVDFDAEEPFLPPPLVLPPVTEAAWSEAKFSFSSSAVIFVT